MEEELGLAHAHQPKNPTNFRWENIASSTVDAWTHVDTVNAGPSEFICFGSFSGGAFFLKGRYGEVGSQCCMSRQVLWKALCLRT